MAFSGFKSGEYVPIAGKCKKTKVAKYRSSYELRFCRLLDEASKVVAWEYEQYWIRYDFRGHRHSYLVDFVVTLNDGQKYFIEIKPKTFYLRAMMNKDKNWHKWNAAISFCNSHGYKFKVITECTIPALAKAWLGRPI